MRINELLKIPKGYKITKLEKIKEDEIEMRLEPYENKELICSGCGKIHKEGFHGSIVINAIDFPIVGQKVNLEVVKRRVRCSKDGNIYVESIDWLKKKAELPIDMLMKYTV